MIEKFDYDKAKKLLVKKKDKCIVTKKGLPVKILTMDIGNTDNPICGVIDGKVYQFDKYGYCISNATYDLVLDIPTTTPKKPFMVKSNEPIKHEFYWHPIKEKPTDLDTPVIFLTNKGRMVTHSKLKGNYVAGHGYVNLFSSYAQYSNAVAWVYQKELFNVEDFKPVEYKINCKNCDQNPSNCISSPYCIISNNSKND